MFLSLPGKESPRTGRGPRVSNLGFIIAGTVVDLKLWWTL